MPCRPSIPWITPLWVTLGVVLFSSTGMAAPQSGAQHWAYARPARPSVPDVAHAAGSQHPIDAFVLRRLRADGRTLSPRASRIRLLRRVYLDLIGMPPTVEQIDAYLADDAPGSYERVVDGLLASPRFGEHWARHWLDLARYADSNGFQADQLRDSWAYRDWVIEAFNRDLPFDEFTIHQLAGDLLPQATLAQKIATGFHRTVPCNVEAGVHPEANRVNQVVDRVNTTATVWLGSTIACAQCHDHKYDPFSQAEYYALFAFFNNTPIEVKNPLGKGVRFDFYGPRLELPLRPEQEARRQRLRRELAGLKAEHRQSISDSVEEQAAWETRMARALTAKPRWQPLPVLSFQSTGEEDAEILPDASVLVGGRIPDTTTYTLRTRPSARGIRAFRIETLTHPSLPGTGPGRGDAARPNFILSEFTVHQRRGESPPQSVALHHAGADYAQKNWPAAAAIDGDPRKGWAIGGGFGRSHHATFWTEEPVGDGDTEFTFTLDQNYGRGRTIGRVRISAFTGDPEVLDAPLAIRKILRKSARSPAERKQLRRHFLRHHAGTARLERQIQALEARLAKLAPDTTLVMVESEARASHIMRRGDYLRPGPVVTPKTPAALHGWRDAWPRNRLGLARWLVAEDNPLTARVTVNRFWALLFGRGLVATQEDFGTRAAAPTHPALLDWLATEFVAAKWSMKHMLRLMVTSSTYQQSSRFRGDAARSDPKNLTLGRGPRFRMTAEMIRDSGLVASGLLSTATGGPPVFPPQPAGLWRQIGRNEPKYVVATDADRFRRGIYVIWRRAAPYPSFVLFDGPDRAACVPRRSRTNTPMQALTLMNDTAYVEMALGLARRALTHPGTTGQRVEYAFRRVLTRRPTDRERTFLTDLWRREHRRLAEDPQRAAALVKSAPGPAVPAADRVALASWFFVATILLNLDEAITKG